MGAWVQGFQVLLASVVKEVTSLPGTPSLSPLLEGASGAALGAADGSLQAMACVHTMTQPHSSPQAPWKDCVQPGPQPGNTPGFRHNFPFFPAFDPGEAVVPVGDGLHLACGLGIILAGASSRRP